MLWEDLKNGLFSAELCFVDLTASRELSENGRGFSPESPLLLQSSYLPSPCLLYTTPTRSYVTTRSIWSKLTLKRSVHEYTLHESPFRRLVWSFLQGNQLIALLPHSAVCEKDEVGSCILNDARCRHYLQLARWGSISHFWARMMRKCSFKKRKNILETQEIRCCVFLLYLRFHRRICISMRLFLTLLRLRKDSGCWT